MRFLQRVLDSFSKAPAGEHHGEQNAGRVRAGAGATGPRSPALSEVASLPQVVRVDKKRRARNGLRAQWVVALVLLVGLVAGFGVKARQWVQRVGGSHGVPVFSDGLSEADKELATQAVQTYYDGLKHGSFRQSAEVVTPPVPTATVSRAAVELAHDLMGQGPATHFDACTTQVQAIGWAVEQWSADHEDTAELPTSLKELVPQYFKALPTCPDADGAAYHYEASRTTGQFTVTCSGQHHVLAGAIPDSPEYSSTFGVNRLTQPLANLHPRLTAYSIQSVQADGQQAIVTVQEQLQRHGHVNAATSVLHVTPAGPQWKIILPAASNEALPGKGLGESFLVALALEPGRFAIASSSKDKLTACKYNLQRLGAALDAWSSDHDGTYPAALADLVPRYIRSLPQCPVDEGSYSSGYTANGSDYTLYCAGSRHAGCNVPDGYPRMDTTTGLLLGPDSPMQPRAQAGTPDAAEGVSGQVAPASPPGDASSQLHASAR